MCLEFTCTFKILYKYICISVVGRILCLVILLGSFKGVQGRVTGGGESLVTRLKMPVFN